MYKKWMKNKYDTQQTTTTELQSSDLGQAHTEFGMYFQSSFLVFCWIIYNFNTNFRVFSVCHDAASRFVKLLTVHSPQGRDYVDEADLIPLVQVKCYLTLNHAVILHVMVWVNTFCKQHHQKCQ